MKILAIAAVLAVAGCGPRVIVEDEYRLRQARISLDSATTGKMTDIRRTETPTTTVITITFERRRVVKERGETRDE